MDHVFDPPLVPATLVRRYKRFLADVTLQDGREVTAHCANPGAMTGVAPQGGRVWLQPATNPARKLRWSWMLLELGDGHLVGIDTGIPNKIVGAALGRGAIAPLAAYGSVRAEVKYAKASRVDFLLTQDGLPDCYVEVKNCHLRRTGTLAEFPDSVTARGARHMADLAEMVAQGHRAVLIWLVQRTDCTHFGLAADIDPAYAQAVADARSAGVEMLCFDTTICVEGITLGRALPITLPA